MDMHSHLLPGIDDGVNSWDESLFIIEELQKAGYSKLITTPHIMSGYYPNTPKIILEKYNRLKDRLMENGLNIEITAAAEYYADEYLFSQIKSSPENLLFLNNKMLLFELPMFSGPVYLQDMIFEMRSTGITPVLAHPERYGYVQENKELLRTYQSWGIQLQLNLLSLWGYYGIQAKKIAQWMIDAELVDFVGSDIHNRDMWKLIKSASTSKYIKKLGLLKLKNSRL